jgi:aspartate-semialdehyde dehydrogenase
VIKAGIVGGTGYTGVELLRLLVNHPQVEVSIITSRAEAGVKVADMYPSLRGHIDLAFTEPDVAVLGELDVVFFATPHGVAQNMMPALMATNTRIIDLSADFRIRDVPLMLALLIWVATSGRAVSSVHVMVLNTIWLAAFTPVFQLRSISKCPSIITRAKT